MLVFLFIYINLLSAVEVRRSLHSRLGLPFDRPLLRIANAINLSITKESTKNNYIRKGNIQFHICAILVVYGVYMHDFLFAGSPLLKDVHLGIPASGGNWF